MSVAPLLHTAEGITFEWYGGSYITLHWADAYRLRPADSDEPDPGFTVDNVWDYETDKPTIARTQEALDARCVEWLAENRHELNLYLENGAY